MKLSEVTLLVILGLTFRIGASGTKNFCCYASFSTENFMKVTNEEKNNWNVKFSDDDQVKPKGIEIESENENERENDDREGELNFDDNNSEERNKREQRVKRTIRIMIIVKDSNDKS